MKNIKQNEGISFKKKNQFSDLRKKYIMIQSYLTSQQNFLLFINKFTTFSIKRTKIQNKFTEYYYTNQILLPMELQSVKFSDTDPAGSNFRASLCYMPRAG